MATETILNFGVWITDRDKEKEALKEKPQVYTGKDEEDDKEKENKNAEAIVLQINFHKRQCSLMQKGKVNSEFLFDDIRKVSEHSSNPCCLLLQFVKNMRPHMEILTQLIEEKMVLAQLFRRIVEKQTVDEQNLFRDWLKVYKRGSGKKKGKRAWAKRYLVLHQGILVVYREEGDENPLNVILIRNAEITNNGEDEFVIKNQFRSYEFKVEPEEHRNWMQSFEETKFVADRLAKEAEEKQRLKTLRKAEKSSSKATSFEDGQLKDLTKENKKLLREVELKPSECDKYFPILCNCLRAATHKPPTELLKRLAKQEVKMKSKEKSRRLKDKDSKKEGVAHFTQEELDKLLVKENPEKLYGSRTQIDKGGFGVVYIAKDKKTGQMVCMKNLKKRFSKHSDRIANEIKVLVAFQNHENVVNFIKSYLWKDKVTIIMEYCSGGSIRELSKNFDLQEEHVAYVCKETLNALAYLHKDNHIHRDIKSSNIVLNLDGTVKLADMGTAVDLEEEEHGVTNFVGTTHFMAPEVIKRDLYDQKIDIWSFGAMVMEMAEKAPPYKNYPAVKALFRTATKGAPPLKYPHKWSDQFKDFLKGCFMVDPKERSSSADLQKHPFLEKACTREKFAKVIESVFVGNFLKQQGFLK